MSGVSLTITLKVAVELRTSRRKWASWRAPSIVREGSLIFSTHLAGTGRASVGTSSVKAWRMAGGAVGARSGAPATVHRPPAEAFAERNDRSSRKNSSRCLPQRNVR
jgi:hypothetical protein